MDRDALIARTLRSGRVLACCIQRVRFIGIGEIRRVWSLAKLPSDALGSTNNVAGMPLRIHDQLQQFVVLLVRASLPGQQCRARS